MLKEFKTAVRQFQQALAQARIAGDVDVTLPREPMLKLYTEWVEAPVMRFGPLPVDFERSVFQFLGPGGMWTFRHRRPEMASYGKFISAVGHLRAQTHEQQEPKRKHAPGCIHSTSDHPEGCYVMTGEYNAARSSEKIAEPPAPGYSVEERRVRDVIRRQLLAALFKHGTPPDISLDAAIDEAGNRVVCAGSALALVISRARDAALEDAAQVVGDELDQKNGWVQQRIRALKSKSAPDSHPKLEDYCPECERPKTAHGMSCSQDVRPRPHSNGCSLDADHKGACFGPSLLEMERQETRMYQSPDPIHDFGWALAQMRAGKKVRREAWVDGAIVDIKSKGFTGKMECLLATDWEVVP